VALSTVLVVAALGCAGVVQTRKYPALDQAAKLGSVAVVPFEARSRGTGALPKEGPEVSGAPVVARQVAEALSARGLNVIPPEDVARAMSGAGLGTDAKPEAIAALAYEKFGANAFVTGQVWRYRDRRGANLGASAPASVGFEVVLHSAPRPERLWSATFDETQEPVSANLFNLGRYPGGGSRWLTADELSKWGAEGVADAFPVSP
jgi:hypothetical protein